VSAHNDLHTHRLIAAFVDELARGGVTDVCTSPGSRSTPLVLALARDPRLRAHSHIDERTSGFFALGVAKASGRPVAVTCTSGTAAANLLPAVIEASEAGVPLLILTADRPAELRGIGAGQTIDQVKLYGDAVRWFFEVGTHQATPDADRWMRTLACRALAAAVARPGPVQLNFPLREPLVAEAAVEPLAPGRPDGRPWVTVGSAPSWPVPLSDHVAEPRRGVIVAGRDDRGLAPAIPQLAAACGYPLLADPLSGARSGAAAIAHYDLLLRDAAFAGAHAPEVVIRVGDLPTSKALRTWLAGLGDARQVTVAAHLPWQDPSSVVELVLAADPRLLEPPPAAETGWLDMWRAADAIAAATIAEELGGELSEPNVARTIADVFPSEATLFVAASMPIRDLETFWPARDHMPRVLSNRGANGIDGTLATAFGVATASAGPVVALLGDVAFAHDLAALLSASRLRIPITIVLLDNGGGAIFDHLPVAAATDAYEQHVATPPGIDPRAAADLYDLAYETPTSLGELRDALARASGATLLHVRTERPAELALHRRVAAATSRALAAARPA
jgi:2-succinyl-5-enolpyruvyl-6-hydroxy-3-cyclohexene-1-carboxylate synthase